MHPTATPFRTSWRMVSRAALPWRGPAGSSGATVWVTQRYAYTGMSPSRQRAAVDRFASPYFVASAQAPRSRSANPLVLVILALAAARPQFGKQRRSSAVEARVRFQRRLIAPALEQREPVGVQGALEDLELLAAGLLHHLRAAGAIRLRELGSLAGDCGDRHDESNGHVASLSARGRTICCSRRRVWHGLPERAGPAMRDPSAPSGRAERCYASWPRSCYSTVAPSSLRSPSRRAAPERAPATSPSECSPPI